MKSIGKLLIIPIVIGIVVTTYTYYINLQKVDVRYTLSEKIPFNMSESTSPEAIQQLEVKNIGNNQAEKVVIDIYCVVKKYEITKYSEADEYEVYSKQDYFEIVYPALPPQGSIKVVINSEGKGIRKEDLIVKHNKGLAIEALSKDTSMVSWLPMLFMYLLFISLFVWGFREMSISSWEWKAKYTDEVDTVLRRNPPIYIGKDRWIKIRKIAVETKSIDKFISEYNLTQNACYKVLSSQKPDYIKEDEWISIIEEQSKSLQSKMKSAISENTQPDRIISLLKIAKPKHFPEEKWTELNNLAYDKYILLKKDSALRHLTIESAVQAFKENRPPEIPEQFWSEYIYYLRREYCRLIDTELFSNEKPIEFINGQALEYLNTQDREIIVKDAYRKELNKFRNIYEVEEAKKVIEGEKPSWIKDEDYKSVISRANRIIDTEKERDCFNKKLVLMNELILECEFPKEKPDYLSKPEWDALSKAHSEISNLNPKIEENMEKEQENSKKEKELSLLKDKVIKQLNVINQVLSEPNSIDRIEDYENVFAPGNYKNLKRIAEMLKADRT